MKEPHIKTIRQMSWSDVIINIAFYYTIFLARGAQIWDLKPQVQVGSLKK